MHPGTPKFHIMKCNLWTVSEILLCWSHPDSFRHFPVSQSDPDHLYKICTIKFDNNINNSFSNDVISLWSSCSPIVTLSYITLMFRSSFNNLPLCHFLLLGNPDLLSFAYHQLLACFCTIHICMLIQFVFIHCFVIFTFICLLLSTEHSLRITVSSYRFHFRLYEI